MSYRRFAVLLSCLLLLGSVHASVLITEFMANNNRTLADEEGDHPDWLELFNAGVETVNLGGWYLSDDAADLKKWRFPSTNLPPHRHLVVFASNKDRRVSGARLHTNFRLAAGAEYLVLTRPDGTTIESSTPAPFPPQVPDVAYGIPVVPETVPIVTEGTSVRFLVPQNDLLDPAWREFETDDSAWSLVKPGVGFEATPNAPEFSLLTDSVTDFGGAQGVNGWSYGYYNRTTDPNNSYGVVDFRPFPSSDGPYGLDNYWNGTSWKWALPNPPFTEIGPELMRPTAATSGGHEHWPVRRWVSSVEGALVVEWRLVKLVSGGGGVTLRVTHKGAILDTLVLAGTDVEATNRVLQINNVKVGDPIDFLLSPAGPGNNLTDTSDESNLSVRIGVRTSLDALIATDVGSTMRNRNASAWMRIPFVLDNPARYQRLLLRLRYDDGFVAWLNGVEVAHDNAPENLRFDSAATAVRSEHEAAAWTEIDLTPRLGILRPGQNLLAIQGLNRSADDTDFLLSPELVGTTVNVDPSRFLYLYPATPGGFNGVGNTNLGPVVVEVTHTPTEPADDEDLTIQARVVRTFQDVASVQLKWRVMFNPEATAPMFDDGAHGDGAAGDGVWAATLPANSYTNGQMIRWYVTATDTSGDSMSLPAYPDARTSPRYLGTVVKDVSLTNRLPVLHWFVQNVSSADTTAGARCSIYYRGEFYDNLLANLHGQSSAGFPKHSYNLDFNPGNGFRYEPGSPRVDDVNLLTTWPDKAKVRNILAYETHRDAGYAYHFVIPIRVQRNAQFFGDWHMVEDGDEEYLARVGLPSSGALYKMYDTFASKAPAAEKKTRKNEPNSDLAELYQGITRSGAARTQYLYDNVDIPGMVNYLAIMILTANIDCCHKNYYAYRDTEGTREWKYLPWDQDLSFGRNWTSEKAYQEDRMFVDNPLQVGGNNTLISALFADSKFMAMYNRRIRSLMDQLLQPTNTLPAALRYEKRIAELGFLLEPDAALDFKKWPTWGAKQTLAQAMNILTNRSMTTNYLPRRRAYLYGQSGGSKPIPAAQNPNVNIEFGAYEVSPASGNSDEEYVILRNTNTVAVDLTGWRIEGDITHRFIPGTVLPSGGLLHLSPNVLAFRARAQNPRGGQALFVQGAYQGQLSARGGTLRLLDGERLVAQLVTPPNPTPAQSALRISELMADPAAPPLGSAFSAGDFEFVEFYNAGSAALDLRTLRLTAGVDFDFSGSVITNLPPQGIVLVVRNAAAFRSRYGQGLPIAGEFTGQLDNNGERLRVEDHGEVVLEFRYPDVSSFPGQSAGRSLTVLDAQAAWTAWGDPALWALSDSVGGTPGTHTSRYTQWAAQRFTPVELADPNTGGSGADADLDGETNLREYLAGTNPRDAASRLTLATAHGTGDTKVVLVAPVVSGRTYTIQSRDGLTGGDEVWQKVADIPAGATRQVAVTDPDGALRPLRFYRIVTPAVP